jgi:hypothetical protein
VRARKSRAESASGRTVVLKFRDFDYSSEQLLLARVRKRGLRKGKAVLNIACRRIQRSTVEGYNGAQSS